MPEELTNTDKKIIYSDHDLLVRLTTLVENDLKRQEEFRTEYRTENKDIVQRLTALEVNQATNITQIKANQGDIADLQKKSDRNDVLNALGTVIAGAFAAWFGGSR
jgi:hypothetical protein